MGGQNTSSEVNGRGEARQLLVEKEGQDVMIKWPLLNEQVVISAWFPYFAFVARESLV